MTWGFSTPGHFMRPFCPGFPGVLAPCLLGGRMLAGGLLVKNGLIGLDQSSESLPMLLPIAIVAGKAAAKPSPVNSPLPARGPRPYSGLNQVDLNQRAAGIARAGAAGRWSASSAAATRCCRSGSPLGDALAAAASFASRSPGTASPGQTCGRLSAGFAWPVARRPRQANHLPLGWAPPCPQPCRDTHRDYERRPRCAPRYRKAGCATMSTSRLPCVATVPWRWRSSWP